jgi:hypothetical protein
LRIISLFVTVGSGESKADVMVSKLKIAVMIKFRIKASLKSV